ncbi:hypothetical protein EFE41_09860 [Methanohalophilus portucalensis FDF-1]|nr:hypothetical protein BKM01_02115 [Methanohalophilus portucalensis]RNI08801.1 hypothetical protein EFE41_09860 [Methanohalophilus portucalensis FDF-1]
MENHCLEMMEETSLKEENILERYDLQKTILSSWDLFKNEIELPDSFLIGEEIKPHEATNDSIDLLAYEPNESSLIVIELKRSKNKLQLLQSLSYAAMVNTWNSEKVIANIQSECNSDSTELIDLLKDMEINPNIKIVLIAEYYDPEVIITADWLSNNYSVDITAFSISIFRLDHQKFVALKQVYPLKELKDAYEIRGSQTIKNKVTSEIEWKDLLPKFEYSFAEEAIAICKKYSPGEPKRRRFSNIRSNYDGFTWISVNFRHKYITAYIKGDYEGAQEHLKSKFTDLIEINTWRDGLSFRVYTDQQYRELFDWLDLK